MEAMCADSWRWISGNPNGFGDEVSEAAGSVSQGVEKIPVKE